MRIWKDEVGYTDVIRAFAGMRMRRLQLAGSGNLQWPEAGDGSPEALVLVLHHRLFGH